MDPAAGAWVLFNVYGPAITDAEKAAERLKYKCDFYQVRGYYYAQVVLFAWFSTRQLRNKASA